jgi:hypothetical protein
MADASGFIGRTAVLTILTASVARAAAADGNDGTAAPSDWRSAMDSAYTWTPPPSSPSGPNTPAVFTWLQPPQVGEPTTPSYLPYGEPYAATDQGWWSQMSSDKLQWRPADFLLDKFNGDRRPTGHPSDPRFYLHTIRFRLKF